MGLDQKIAHRGELLLASLILGNRFTPEERIGFIDSLRAYLGYLEESGDYTVRPYKTRDKLSIRHSWHWDPHTQTPPVMSCTTPITTILNCDEPLYVRVNRPDNRVDIEMLNDLSSYTGMPRLFSIRLDTWEELFPLLRQLNDSRVLGSETEAAMGFARPKTKSKSHQ